MSEMTSLRRKWLLGSMLWALSGCGSCSYHAEWHAGKGSSSGQTSGSEAPRPPSHQHHHGVHVSVTPHGDGGGGGAQPAPQGPTGQSSAVAPISVKPTAAPTGSSSAAAPISVKPTAAPTGSSSAAAPISVKPTAAPTGSSSAAAPITTPPSEVPSHARDPKPLDLGSPNARPDGKPICSPFTLTARIGDVLRLRVLNIPPSAEARLDGRPLTMSSRSGQVWAVSIPADAKTGELTLVDGSTVYPCGRISTNTK
jgi:hypothetical protein